MTKRICDTCERSRVSPEYYPCQIRKVERVTNICLAEKKGQEYTYVQREINPKKVIAKQAKKEREIKNAKSNLESACGLFGWDEHDSIDQALHAKAFLKAYKEAEEVGFLDFEHIAYLIEKNTKIDYPLSEAGKAIGLYISYIQLGNLADLEGRRKENADILFLQKVERKFHLLSHEKEIPF